MKQWKRHLSGLLCLILLLSCLAPGVSAAGPAQIRSLTATGCKEDLSPARNAVDGSTSTFWKSPDGAHMRDYHRFIDIHLDGLYDLDQIKIYNKTGSYYHYEVYASTDGGSFSKIAFKNNNEPATGRGDSYTLTDNEQAKNVSVVRVNVSYNSAAVEGNLAEVKLWGTKVSDRIPQAPGISVPDFEETPWAEEHRKFREDEAYAREKTIRGLSQLVGRVIGEKWTDDFVFTLGDVGTREGKDAFRIETRGGKAYIAGRNATSMAAGFNYYLKRFCHVNYSPMFASNLEMPEVLPEVPGPIIQETQYDVRYALNYCTYSYTMAFWGWEEYEAFLDWCAMSGINLMLDIVGQEEVQRRLLMKYGYTSQEALDYISGPGYFAWYYMQNLSNFGGPLPNNWFAQRVELARKIHDRMQTLGITPILQGYAGMVPTDFQEKHPDAKIVPQGIWCGFERPDMLRTYGDGPNDPGVYFDRMAEDFYAIQKDLFGPVTHYYDIDPFHEGGLVGDMDMATVYNRVQQKMLDSDPRATWVVQQWSGQITDAKLSNLPKPDQLLALDLCADRYSYAGVMEARNIPWVWCMVHNYGGRHGIEGDIVSLTRKMPGDFAENKHMVGVGITLEAFSNSPIMYDLIYDMVWTKDPIDYNAYVADYARSRYGSADEHILRAWDTLLHTAYWKKTVTVQGAPETVVCARPSEVFTSACTWGHSIYDYDKVEFEQCLLDFIEAYKTYGTSETFLYDMSDVVKQVLATSAIDYHKQMIRAYKQKDLESFRKLSGIFLELIRMQDRVLACSAHLTVGKWIHEARTAFEGMDDWTRDLFEFNARALITTWGGLTPSSFGLKDYSNRQWAGLTGDFYYGRWKDFVDRYETALVTGTAPAPKDYFLQEWEWVNRKSDQPGDFYAYTGSGEDLGALAQLVYDRYSVTNMQEYTGEESKENIAKGKTVTPSRPAAAGSTPAQLTDDEVATVWKAREPGAVTFTLDLRGEYDVDQVAFAVPQVAGDYRWDYKIEILMGEKWQSLPVQQQGTLLGVISVPCGLTGSQVRYTFTPKKDAPAELTAEFAELYVLGEKAQKEESSGDVPAGQWTPWGVNIAPTADFGAADAAEMLPNLTDGNFDNHWATGLAFPQAVTATFPQERNLTHVIVYFAGPHQPELNFTVELLNAKGEVVASHEEIREELKGNVVHIPVAGMAKTVRVNFVGRMESSICVPGFAELEIFELPGAWGENIAPIAQIQAEGTPAEELTDGVWDGGWVGGTDYPQTITAELPQEMPVRQVRLGFGEGDFSGLKVRTELLDARGNVTDSYEKTGDSGRVVPIPTAGKAKTVRITFLGHASQGACPAGLAELEIYAASGQEGAPAMDTTVVENLVHQGLHSASSEEARLPELFDGDYGNFWASGQAFPAWIQVNFGIEREITSAKLVFNGIHQQELHFRVELLDEKDRVVDSYVRNEDARKGGMVDIPVSGRAKTVRLTFTGHMTGSVCPSGAAEFEIYGKPLPALEVPTVTGPQDGQEDYSLLLDGDPNTGVTLTGSGPRELNLRYKNPMDIHMIQLVGAKAYPYEIFYTLNGEEYPLPRYSAEKGENTVLTLKKPVLADGLRILVDQDRLNLYDVNVYRYDYRGTLEELLRDICLKAEAYPIGDSSTCVPQEAKDAFDGAIDALRQNVVSSSNVEQLTKEAQKALRKLDDTSIYVHRDPLILSLSDARWLSLRGLRTIYNMASGENAEARQVYNDLKANQPRIDAAARALREKLEAFMVPAHALAEQMEMAEVLVHAGNTQYEAPLKAARQAAAEAKTAEELVAAAKALEEALAQEDLSVLKAAALKELEAIDCTGRHEKQMKAARDGAKAAIEAAKTAREIAAALEAAKAELADLAICPSEDFKDVKADGWYHEAVDYAIENGLMKGVSADRFSIDGTLTRGQLVTILYRAEGSPSVEGMKNPFRDIVIAPQNWYAEAVIWAYNNGIVKGVTDVQFAPMNKITREQLVSILYRYDGSPAAEGNLNQFADADKVSSYASQAMAWGVENSIVSGIPSGNQTLLKPQGNATRAQAAAIMMRFLENRFN